MILDEGIYGPRATLTSEPSAEQIAAMRTSSVVDLVLNQVPIGAELDVRFLEAMPWLESLELRSVSVEDDSPVFTLRNLRRLELETYARNTADLANLRALEHLTFIWRPNAPGLAELNRLRELVLIGYGVNDTREIAGLTDLVTLQILGSAVSDLSGIWGCGKLRKIRLALLRRLTTLSGLERLPELEALTIESCKNIASVEPLGGCARLQELYLDNDGPIASLEPLRSLSRLEALTFVESTNVRDGHIRFLKSMNLKRIAFQDRKHYDARREEFD